MIGKSQVLGMIVAVLVGFGAARANANEMQFLVFPDQPIGSYTESGMTVTNLGGTLDLVGLNIWNTYGSLEFQDGAVLFTVAPGYTFNLNSFIYYTNGYYSGSRWIETSSSVGEDALPGVMNETFYFSGPNYSFTGPDYIYPMSDFTNITWFEMGTGGPNQATGVEFLNFDLEGTVTPEPSSIFLLSSGLLGLASVVRRKLSR